jgi:hypothetical protein
MDTGGRPRLNRLYRAPVPSQPADWESSPAREPEPPERSRGALTQEELRLAEEHALRFGLFLPDPADPAARISELYLIFNNMLNTARGAKAPSVAGDPSADGQRAVLVALGTQQNY